MTINKVFLAGNITRDPEMKSAGGTTVMELSIAVNDRKKVDGEWTEEPNYFDLTMFGTRAEKVSGFLKKGTKIAVIGRLKQSRWEKDGKKRSKVSIVVDDLEFMTAPVSKSESVDAEVLPYTDDVPF